MLLLLLSCFSRVRLWLPYPWDSPGKNTGLGCHFLLQCMRVKSESEAVQSCPTLSDPMDTFILHIFLNEHSVKIGALESMFILRC